MQRVRFLFLLSGMVCMSAWGVTVDILSLNDLHGMLQEHGKNPGIAKVAQFVKTHREQEPNTLLVGGGDLYQGTAISNLTFGRPVNESLRMMGLVATAVGNHEFDWGSGHFTRWNKELDAPLLATNVAYKDADLSMTWNHPYAVAQVGGKKIALLGLTTMETSYKTNPRHVANINFMNPTQTAKYWIPIIKRKERPDAIVALTHISAFQDANTGQIHGTGNELEHLSLVKDLDAIVTGHSHQKIAGHLNGIPIVQGWRWGRGLGWLHLRWNQEGDLNITPRFINLSAQKDHLKALPAVQDKVAQYERSTQALLSKKVGYTPSGSTHNREQRGVSSLGYWLSEVTRRISGADVAILNGGGIRRGLAAGPITMGDLYEVLPFDNQIVVLNMTGAQLKAAIEHGLGSYQDKDFSDGQFAGVVAIVDWSMPYGQRLQGLKDLDARDIYDDRLYRVAVNDFMAAGGDGYPLAQLKGEELHHVMRDVAYRAIVQEHNIPSNEPEPVLMNVTPPPPIRKN